MAMEISSSVPPNNANREFPSVVDRVPVVDAEKFAVSPDNFDKCSRWRILEPLVASLKPKYEDPSLVYPTTFKYSD